MFCKNCGNKVEEEWKSCPYCGEKLHNEIKSDEIDISENRAENNEIDVLENEMEKVEELTSECRNYKLLGCRRTGRFTFEYIPTYIQVEGENFHVTTHKNKCVENQFNKSEVVNVKFSLSQIWRIWDIIALVIFGILLFFTYGLGIFAIIFIISWATTWHVKIKLISGSVVKIPIRQKADASEFLKELDYPSEEIEKINAKRISDKKWSRREWFQTMILAFIASLALYIGKEMKADDIHRSEIEQPVTRQQDNTQDSDNMEMVGDADDKEDMGLYLTNDSGALPVLIENVSLENYFYGFTTISFDMVNSSDVDIKEATFGFVAWDSNMLPLELTGMYDYDVTYFYEYTNNDNIAKGQTLQESKLFEEKDFKYMQILLLEYTDFDGNTWTNPAASYYEDYYAGKRFDENTMIAWVFDKKEEVEEPAEEKVAEDKETIEYIFPYSDNQYLSEDELWELPVEVLRVGRNEIFARHGYIFNDKELQAYFESTSWYKGTVKGEDFDMEAELNEYEKANAELIRGIEETY